MPDGDDPTPYIVLGIFGLVLFAVVSWTVRSALDRRYRDKIAAWAAAQGWNYREGGGGSWTQGLEQGIARGVELQMEGSRRDRQVTVAHYWYQTRESRQEPRQEYCGGQWTTRWETNIYTVTHDLTVLAVHLPSVYPEISVESRGLGSRIAHSFGWRDRNRLEQDSFDHAYRVRTEDPELGRSVVTPALVEAHLAGTVPLWSLRDHDLFTTWEGKIRVDLVPNRLDQLLDVADLLGTI
ncbi:MAG: hypothetical protein ACRDSZ_12555 [Pseudonocardiaceae bacterium]